MINPDALERYLSEHTSAETQVLQRLNRETHLHILRPQMLSGHVQGAFLGMLSHLLKPMRVLEIGTFTGYSAICLAQGMPLGGLLYTIDINEELKPLVQRYVKEAGMETVIKPLVGNALQIIPTLEETFDLVFIDADKENYSAYYDLVFEKVRPGGFILADNVLWYGKVLDEQAQDKDTLALKAFNTKVQQDARVENVMLSIRDGLMLVRKKDI